MELYPLKVFLTVATENSFSRAAERLLRTQPAISLAVQRLENELGEKLIDRSSTPPMLTDAGRTVLEYARRFLPTGSRSPLLGYVDALDARLALECGDLVRAEELIAQLDPSPRRARLRARLRLRRGEPDEAVLMLDAHPPTSPRQVVDDLLLLVDGIPAGGAFIPQVEAISLTNVERIEVIRGATPVYFGTTASSIEYIRSGKLRPLAVTTATRAAVLPDIPALAEFLPTYEASIYVGIAAPRNTPAEIIRKLNQEINLALADSKMTLWIPELGDTPLSLSSSDFGKLIADETEKWGKVVKFAGIKAE